MILSSFKGMSYLLVQKEEVKGGPPKQTQAKPPAGPGATSDKNVVKKNLNLAIEIISRVFSVDSPKSVQKLGLFELQPLLNDYKSLYQPYVEVLVQIDQEIKSIILSDEPIRAGEDIYFSLGNLSFNYKLKSDLGNFDKILLANALIDVVIHAQYESLESDHMQLLTVCCGNAREFVHSHQAESWLKVFQKLKDYLLVSICDPELCEQGLHILHNFLTADAVKFQVFEDCRDIFLKSLELLYQGDSAHCKQKFREYLTGRVLAKGESADNSLKKFFKALLQKFSEEQQALFASSNVSDALALLST